MQKLKLHGFNNLTKNLGFCIYSVFYVETDIEKNVYFSYIDEKYNSSNISKILDNTCSIIGAKILNTTRQEYDPVGSSVTMLISDNNIINKNNSHNTGSTIREEHVIHHLDKSHICAHTYPENNCKNAIYVFRIDIEISTCGIISPLKALNYLIDTLKPNVITIDYRIRGFTRDINMVKYFNDHKIDSIQEFICDNIKCSYDIIDVNIKKENIFYTKMLFNKLSSKHLLFKSNKKIISFRNKHYIKNLIFKEMKEIFYSTNM